MENEPAIVPGKDFPFNTEGVVWTFVSPTRHPYASVVRESTHGTTVYVNNDTFTLPTD